MSAHARPERRQDQDHLAMRFDSAAECDKVKKFAVGANE